MSKLPLIALQRMRTELGTVVLPGSPVPGSHAWSDAVRARRVKQGFCAEQAEPKPAKKAKRKTKAAKEE